MSDRSLLIRADASSQIGGGHVMRCLALARTAMEQGWPVAILSHDVHPALRRRIEEAGCRVISLDRAHPDPADLEKTLEVAREVQAAWVVIDGYPFDAEYQAAIRGTGRRLMVVDDHGHRARYHADLLFNQNIHAERIGYVVDPGTVFLLGPRYALIRPEFRTWRHWKREMPAAARKVLVTLGGADPDNVTGKIIEALRGLDVAARIIAGGLNVHLEDLRSMVSENMEILTDVTNMPEHMAWADLAILGGGSTCWEAALMGLPALMIVLADNQRGIAAGLDEEGIGVNLGEGKELKAETMAEQVKTLLQEAGRRHRMSVAGQALVDGDGAKRVLDYLRG